MHNLCFVLSLNLGILILIYGSFVSIVYQDEVRGSIQLGDVQYFSFLKLSWLIYASSALHKLTVVHILYDVLERIDKLALDRLDRTSVNHRATVSIPACMNITCAQSAFFLFFRDH